MDEKDKEAIIKELKEINAARPAREGADIESLKQGIQVSVNQILADIEK